MKLFVVIFKKVYVFLHQLPLYWFPLKYHSSYIGLLWAWWNIYLDGFHLQFILILNDSKKVGKDLNAVANVLILNSVKRYSFALYLSEFLPFIKWWATSIIYLKINDKITCFPHEFRLYFWHIIFWYILIPNLRNLLI